MTSFNTNSYSLDKNDILVFVETLTKIFEKISNESPIVETPSIYNTHEEIEYLEYIAIIQITGNFEGSVYWTMNRGLLEYLCFTYLKHKEFEESSVRDMAGEILNVFSGNLREIYGSNFKISTPYVFLSSDPFPHEKTFEVRYSIPIFWRGFASTIILNLKKTAAFIS